MANKSQNIDLVQLFGMAAQALASNQGALNQADTGNHNHGDNMVQTFNLITQALTEQKDSAPADQLAYASQMLSKNAKSGSGQVYAQGLAQAAKQFQGQKAVTPKNGMALIQSLLGGAQAVSNSSNALDSLMGLAQGEQLDAQDVGSLLNAGMAFLNAKQQGQGSMQAAVSALVSGGPLGQQAHRQQSGEMVASALMQAISAFTK